MERKFVFLETDKNSLTSEKRGIINTRSAWGSILQYEIPLEISEF